MKKQLLAIAVSAAAAAPLASMAQENANGPNVYGRWDVTAQKSESISVNGNQAPDGSGSTIVSNGRYNSTTPSSNVGDHQELRNNTSFIGVKGGADLDHQLQAMYQLEMAFNPGLDSANAAGNNVPGFTLRNTYAGVSSDSWGKVFVGRYDSVIKQAEFSVDQFGYTDADMAVFMGSRGQARYDDTLNYHSPKFGPSIQVKLQFRPGESRVDNDFVQGGPTDRDRETSLVDGMGISLGMQEGNMYGAIAYETNQVKLGGATTVAGTPNTDLEIMRVTGGLDDDMFGVGFLYEQHDSSDAGDVFANPAPAADGDDSRSGWMLSGRYNVTEPLAIKLQYGDSETRYPGHGASNDNGSSIVSTSLGADYSLGKQTKVYTFYSMNEVDDDLPNANASDDSEFNVLAVGMEHKF